MTEQEFWDATMPEPNTGCALWTRSPDKKGYGRLSWNGRPQQAHRIAYQIANGPIDAGLLVCHRCDTPACVNPEHLFLGTNQQNLVDCVRKGRHPGAALTHCKRGHEFTPANTRVRSVAGGRTARVCRACHRTEKGRK
jgi:hypothetical protein